MSYETSSKMIRKAYHASSWYDDDEKKLKASITNIFDKINNYKLNVKAAICPHAGYTYSLETSSHVYSSINTENINNIFIFGPNHLIYNEGLLFPQSEIYETPLGPLKINLEIINYIKSSYENFNYIDLEDDEEEHSIEMQLPLIKYIIGNKDIKIIPIYVGHIGNDIKQIKTYSDIFQKYFQNKSNLFIFSSDFCHFGQRFNYTKLLSKYEDSYIYKGIENMDKDAISIIEQHDLTKFIKYLKETNNTICGCNPIKIMLSLINETSQNIDTKLLYYTQSSHVKNISDSSVSYAAVISVIN